MENKKSKYHKLKERPWGSLEAHDKAQRERNINSWKKLSEKLPDNAFGDNVPDDIDRHGYINKEVTYIHTHSVIEDT